MSLDKLQTLCMVLVALAGISIGFYDAMSLPEYTLAIMAVAIICAGLTMFVFAYIDATKRELVKEIREMQNLADNTP